MSAEPIKPVEPLTNAFIDTMLFVKQVKLPPLSAADKANIIRVEPERLFLCPRGGSRAELLGLALDEDANIVSWK